MCVSQELLLSVSLSDLLLLHIYLHFLKAGLEKSLCLLFKITEKLQAGDKRHRDEDKNTIELGQ